MNESLNSVSVVGCTSKGDSSASMVGTAVGNVSSLLGNEAAVGFNFGPALFSNVSIPEVSRKHIRGALFT